MNTENKNEVENTAAQLDALKEKGKILIDDLGMSCDNDVVVIDTLLALLEVFSQPVANANAKDIVEGLQQHLFTWTKESDNSSFNQWKESVLSGEKYQIQTEATI